MTLNITRFAITFLSALTCILSCSCKKDAPTCTGNCVDVTISGRAYLKTDDSGLAGVPVEVNWAKAIAFSDTYKIASGNTASDGRFSFHVTIDSNFFKDHFLVVSIPEDTNYLAINSYEIRFSGLAVADMQNIEFVFYPKANLTINLHRVSFDNFLYFSVDHIYTNSFIIGDYSLTGSQYAKDTSFTVTTSADIYTKIIWTKSITAYNSVDQTDSLICKRNSLNSFDINF